jgi:hypothetical protein
MCSRPFSTSMPPLTVFKVGLAKKTIQAIPWHGPGSSELSLALGERTQAQSAAYRAAKLQPDLAHTMTVLGLCTTGPDKNRRSQSKHLPGRSRLDSAAPMARLGMGLAKIREGQLAGGRCEIEIAVCLDPGNALIRSYLGKAYYEEKRDGPASGQLAAAKAA